MTDFSIVEGLVSLLASYYIFHVNYPKSIPAFIQEYLLGVIDPAIRKPARYKAFVNSLKKSDLEETENGKEPE